MTHTVYKFTVMLCACCEFGSKQLWLSLPAIASTLQHAMTAIIIGVHFLEVPTYMYTLGVNHCCGGSELVYMNLITLQGLMLS